MSRAAVSGTVPASFALYVEGPRDRDILEAWARHSSPRLAREMPRVSVILGGRQPARAVEHLRAARSRDASARGLCVLDRDGRLAAPLPNGDEPGLEFFVWRRRHIESYLLVPDAIRRSLGLREEDPRIPRFFRAHFSQVGNEQELQRVDAKRLFARHGALSQALGRPVSPGRVARAMRASELHQEVLALLARLEHGLGLRVPETMVRRS